MVLIRKARFGLGQIVRHRDYPFRGVVVDVDAACLGPVSGEVDRDQPFYQVFAYGEDGGFIAYAPEEVLVEDVGAEPLTRSEEAQWFTLDAAGRHAPLMRAIH